MFCLVITLAVGGGLHRYFAHRAFRTSRAFQLGLGLLASAIFGDPITFAGKHRLHHRHSDTARDIDDPSRGAWHCWIGHMLEEPHGEDEVLRAVPDLRRYPELMWLRRFYSVPAVVALGLMAVLGGFSMLAVYAASWCLMAFHAPALVNYFCHRAGTRRFETPDRSTNNVLLGVLLFGEGWHNNHHRFPRAARAGLRWYEIDLLYYALRGLEGLGLVWDLRDVPREIRTGTGA